eukprot:2620578-Amphidinium_carterae.1
MGIKNGAPNPHAEVVNPGQLEFEMKKKFACLAAASRCKSECHWEAADFFGGWHRLHAALRHLPHEKQRSFQLAALLKALSGGSSLWCNKGLGIFFISPCCLLVKAIGFCLRYLRG